MRSRRRTTCSAGRARRRTAGTRLEPRPRTPRTTVELRRSAGRPRPSRRAPCAAPPAASPTPCPQADCSLARVVSPYPKIELHVHLEGAVRAHTLLEIANRNDYPLPADTVEGLAELYRFRDFRHFIEVWILTTNALQKEADFRQMVVDYAAEAASHGAVYLEGIFSPAERVRRGCAWEDIFEGVCNGADEARATVEWSARYRDRGVVGVGLGGLEAEFPPEPYTEVFALAKSLGLGSVPHAGEAAGAASVRGALESLQADRLRHGIRAA